MTELVLPLAFWNGPPTHSITCLIVVPETNTVVTGSRGGQLCLWKIESVHPRPGSNRAGASVDSKLEQLKLEQVKNGLREAPPSPSKSRRASDPDDGRADERRVQPHFVLYGHRQAVSAVTHTTFEFADVVISVSQDGTLCTWDIRDGRCLASHPGVLRCCPTSVVALPSNRHVACAGRHTDIEIFNLEKKEITSVLSTSSGVSSLFSVDLRENNLYSPLLISAGTDGVVHFWTLKKEGDSLPSTPLSSVSAVSAATAGEPVSVSLSPNAKVLLVVAPKLWTCYTGLGPRDPRAELHTVPRQAEDDWAGGKFVSNTLVVVWTQTGVGYLYSIPGAKSAVGAVSLSGTSTVVPEADEEDDFGGEDDARPANFRHSFLKKLRVIKLDRKQPVCVFERRAPSHDCLRETRADEAPQPGDICFGACAGEWLASGDETGDVRLWAVAPRNMKPQQPAMAVYPATECSMSKGWWPDACGPHLAGVSAPVAESSPSPPAVAPPATVAPVGMLSTSSGPDGAGWYRTVRPWESVTATLIVEPLMLLVLGFTGGEIGLYHLPSGSRTSAFSIKAHTGAVTALQSSNESPRPLYLISGGEDFAVRVWSFVDNKLRPVLSFSNHTGRILSLLRAPVYDTDWMTGGAGGYVMPTAELWRNTIFTVGEDRSVGMFSVKGMQIKRLFGPHPAAISEVRWQMEQDYLLVRCDDGSVSVWEMSTGQLEGSVYGQSADEIMRAASPLAPEQSGDFSHFANRAIFSCTLPSSENDPPVQMLLLNIKELTGLVHSKQKLNVSADLPSFVPAMPRPPSPFQPEPRQVLPSDIAVQVLSWLLPWGHDADMDALCRSKLSLEPPFPSISYASRGQGGNFSILVPRAAGVGGVGRWTHSEHASALHMLSAIGLAKALMNKEECRDGCSHLLAYLSSIFPDTLPQYVDPSFAFLTYAWRDTVDDVSDAGRSIFLATSNRMPSEERVMLVERLSSELKYYEKLKRPWEKRFSTVLVLSIFATHYPDILTALPRVVDKTARDLVKLMHFDGADSTLRVASVELIGTGFNTWKRYLKEIDTVIQRLFVMTMQPLPSSMAPAALRALLSIGSSEPEAFVKVMGRNIMEGQFLEANHPMAAAITSPPAVRPGQLPPVQQHSAAILILGSLIRQEPVALLPFLPKVAETLVRSLDPHVPHLRDTCLVSTTKVMHTLVRQYPMISFHQETQRLAIGTRESVIVIFDLKTATRWHVLEGHSGPVAAVSFSPNGKTLATYSVDDAQVKFWQMSTGFLGLFGSSTPQCTRTYIVSRADRPISPMNLLEGVKLAWANNTTISLRRDWDADKSLTLNA